MRKFYPVNDRELKTCKHLFRNEDIVMPKRQTRYSAGYDFYIPYDLTIKGKSKAKIFTGIKVLLEERDVLLIFIRSSTAINKGLILTNQVGIIDADYYQNPDNDGHIIIAVTNTGSLPVSLRKGDRIAQGIIMEYRTVDEEKQAPKRIGGLGSTTEKRL